LTEVASAPTVLVEGAYSASPPLRDLIDLAVLVDTPDELRRLRAAARGDAAEFLAAWHGIWDEVEAYYFGQVCPPESFDLIVLNNADAEPSGGNDAAQSEP
jgi:uridine kinase